MQTLYTMQEIAFFIFQICGFLIGLLVIWILVMAGAKLNRIGNTVRRMIHGFYDNLEPKKPKEEDKEKPLWQVCFETEWENAVSRIRKAMGKEPI